MRFFDRFLPHDAAMLAQSSTLRSRNSVCLSHACFVTKQTMHCKHFDTARKSNHSSFMMTPTVVGRRRSLPSEICTLSNPPSNQAVHVSPHNSGIVRLKKLTRTESRQWAFQRAINQGRGSLLTSQKWVRIPKFVIFHRNFDQKPLQVCNKVSFSESLQWQSCSTVNYLSNSINVLAPFRKIWT